jgi:hypothetical protein
VCLPSYTHAVAAQLSKVQAAAPALLAHSSIYLWVCQQPAAARPHTHARTHHVELGFLRLRLVECVETGRVLHHHMTSTSHVSLPQLSTTRAGAGAGSAARVAARARGSGSGSGSGSASGSRQAQVHPHPQAHPRRCNRSRDHIPSSALSIPAHLPTITHPARTKLICS